MTAVDSLATASARDQRPPPPSASRLPQSGERGVTTIAPRVVEKLVARAAAGVPGAHAASVGGLHSLLSPATRSPGSVDADITGATVRLEVHIDAEWPASVVAVAQRARDEIRATVLELAGLDLQVLDVSVEHLVRAEPRPRPRVR
ncbi:MAG: Asp23/Gls24 family envelope stress response protein [Acidimicrobiales bacterium]